MTMLRSAPEFDLVAPFQTTEFQACFPMALFMAVAPSHLQSCPPAAQKLGPGAFFSAVSK